MYGRKIHDLGEKQVVSLQQYPTVGGGRVRAWHSVGARKGVTLEKNDTLKKSLNLTVRKFYWIREKGVGIVNNVLKSSDNVGVKFTSLGEKSRCQLEYSCVYGWNFHVWVKNS